MFFGALYGINSTFTQNSTFVSKLYMFNQRDGDESKEKNKKKVAPEKKKDASESLLVCTEMLGRTSLVTEK